MTLTPEEIKQIEQEASKEASYHFNQEYSKDAYTACMVSYAQGAKKYLLQLKEERERAGKLLDALQDIEVACRNTVAEKLAKRAITEYKNNNQ